MHFGSALLQEPPGGQAKPVGFLPRLRRMARQENETAHIGALLWYGPFCFWCWILTVAVLGMVEPQSYLVDSEHHKNNQKYQHDGTCVYLSSISKSLV